MHDNSSYVGIFLGCVYFLPELLVRDPFLIFCFNEKIKVHVLLCWGTNQGSKCPSLPGFTHWVNPGKPGLGFKPYFGKSGEYWVLKYFKCSDVQNCANWWILKQVR